MTKHVPPFAGWLASCGRSLRDIASEVGVTEGAIRFYSRGRSIPKPKTLRKLVTLTGLPVEAFLYPREKVAPIDDGAPTLRQLAQVLARGRKPETVTIRRERAK